MSLVINTNISSLNSQRQLMSSGNELDQAMERLSSGKRINTAADDAAGLAISNRMTSQIRGIDQAIRNASDGVSLIQTAEGALQESTNILQRMRELAVQSSNGIYSNADRATLDAEVKQLIEELDRIAQTTTFNGQNILDGTLGSVDLQVGSEAGETISFTIDAMNTQNLGLGSTSSDLSGDRIADLTALNATDNTAVTFGQDDIRINGQGLSAFDGSTQRLQDIITDINTNVDGVTASGYNIIQAGTVGDGIIHATDVLTISVFNVADNTQTDFNFSGTNTLDELVTSINTKTGGLVNASLDTAGKLVLSNDTGAGIGLSYENTASGSGYTLASVLGVRDADATDQGGQVPSNNGEFVAGAENALLFTGQLALSSDDGSAVTVSKGANGTDTDLANIGFRESSSNAVTGIALGSGAQGTALAAGDLVINGTSIAATTAAEGLQGKIDNINDVSATTGVTANVSAQQSYGFTNNGPAEVTAQNAYAAGTTSYGELHFAGTAVDNTVAATVDFSSSVNDGFTFTVNDGGGAVTVTIDEASYASQQAVVDDINTFLTAENVEAYLDANNKLAFRATANGAAITVAGFSTRGTGADYAIGSANDLLGFDIENLNGSGGSFSGAAVGFSINGTDISLGTADDDGTISATEIADAVNTASATTGVTAYVDESDRLHFSSDAAFTLGDDANESGFVRSLDSGGSLIAGSHGQSFSELRGNTAPTDFDFSGGAANNVAFAVNDGAANTTVTLTTALTDLAGVVAEINNQLSAAGNTVEAFADENGLMAFRKTTSSNNGSFTITAGVVGTPGDLNNALGMSSPAIESAAQTSAARTGSVIINGYEVTGIDNSDINAAAVTINAQQANTGVTAVLDDNGELQLRSNSSITLQVGNANGLATGKVLGIDFVDADNNGVLDTQTVNAAISLSSVNPSQTISLELNGNAATATGLKDLNTDLSSTVTGAALASISVATQTAAENAIDSIDIALESINSTRSELGAINNRLDFTIANLSNVSENASAARSRIVDADFAAETAALSRAQVLSQASQAMLAQANSRPQQVLQLLQ